MCKAKRKVTEKVDMQVCDNEIEYLLFDAATGNSSTEEKDIVDESNLQELQWINIDIKY